MSATHLESLLEKLCSGDDAAAEAVFRAYEPYLRMVVRRQLPANLRAKMDSVDVVQSVWADVLDGFRSAGWRFADVNHLRAFLVKATRHRLIDRLRQHYRSLKHEVAWGDQGGAEASDKEDTRPSQLAQANELWQRILAICPTAHRHVIELKRQGLSLAEIAEHTGYHPSSVRRILYDLERRLQAASTPATDSP